MGVPLGDGGKKKFNWASELSTNDNADPFPQQCFEGKRLSRNNLRGFPGVAPHL